ncbi:MULTISPECIES: flagellar basal body P-ring formation chaperone FlgA [unclassified Pseudodesulfovibrio]|uniref:flagellar basal body P-ring formation chaperone FlgA n=1 Tax=unclassified Pseudodesulfovibrio TaxID=2661612 RepID=UPI000FEB66BC|nr:MULTISPECIES: flagellar basal body P-ring formation chaperone FlgA [unclassified Pseudodesulfovibrio]MCJ2163180.1 flagellar basal body P-ring formation chaperone FlgA [Pseudodesulfovibrio sp. S3-i]RWU07168.1 flagella basal body P-ring formation protein FlgA [Pseudodesulfovibrio sp. S3]
MHMSSKQNSNTSRSRIIRYIVAACLAAAVLSLPALTGADKGKAWQALVRSAACVKGPDVLLGEIADPVNDIARNQWKTLASIKLWRASTKPGHPVIVTREKLKGALKYYIGDMVNNLVLPSQLSVQTSGRVIDEPELKSRIVAFLTPRAADLGGDVEFTDVQMPRNMFFPNMYDELIISMDSDLKPGRNQIKLHGVTPDGKVISRKSAVVFVNVWKAVPVAARPLNRNERLTKDKISFRRVNLAYKTNVWDGTGGPWRMARTLGTGQAFTLSHLEPVPLIEKGERVTLMYQGNRVQLAIKVEALGEAGMGQQVSVRNMQSNKIIMATVTGDDTVVVR